MAKILGQYYLKNKSAVRKIITALDLKKNEKIVEIGPGKGALTLPLAEECEKLNCKIIAVEKDPDIALKILNDKSLKDVEFIKGDILKELEPISKNPENKNFKLVGNIPYYITGRLLRILSELKNKPGIIVLTIQKEVAERITSTPPKMNLLAAVTQFWAKSEIIKTLGPEDFSPQPKVDSAIIKLTPNNAVNSSSSIANYYKFARICFKQPRKTILNNIRYGLKLESKDILKTLGKNNLTGRERPQDLSIKTLISLGDSFKL